MEVSEGEMQVSKKLGKLLGKWNRETETDGQVVIARKRGSPGWKA